jgi:hypothetical protein
MALFLKDHLGRERSQKEIDLSKDATSECVKG